VLHAAEQQRPDVAEHRAYWRAEILGLDPRKFVFLDETWTKTNMTRLRGRAPRGQRLIDHAPHGHWQTTTFLAALRVDGLTAPLVVDGAINGELFLAYVQQQLAPRLQPGDMVVMDNLSSHKVKGVREAIESVGARVVYLPPYSPDFNPIEKMWSKVKTHLRATKARTQETLFTAIGSALETITSKDATGYFFSCGYTTSQS
jgi:transposase